MEDHLFIIITKGHILKPNVACKLCIGHTAVAVGMLPGPHAGTLLTFRNHPVRILSGIDQSYIAFILFRLLINQGKNTFRACQSHDNGVKLLGHLHKGLGKALCKLQVGSHHTQGNAADSQHRQETSQHCRKHKLHISNVSDHRPHNVGKGIGLRSTFKKRFI